MISKSLIVKSGIAFLLAFFYSSLFFAQVKITGTIKDSIGNPISNVNVYLKPVQGNSIVSFSSSDNSGIYTLLIETKGEFNLFFSRLGYESKSIQLKINSQKELFHNVLLNEKAFELTEIVIKAEKPIKIKKDTIVVDASSFLKGNEEVVEDLLKKIPGLNVESDGRIKVGNQEIEKVMVDGDDFFEKGYKLLTKNLPVAPIDKVEILKKYSNNKHLKDIEESNKVALNLVLKEKAKRVWFGNATLGYSQESPNRYSIQGNLANFGKRNKYYFLTNLNNIGQDVTGDIWHLIRPYNFDQPSSVGDDESVNSFLNLDTFVPNFKESRTNFNNAELLSLNAIFNPTNKLKVKALGFFNWDENDFFRTRTDNFQSGGLSFTNNEDFVLRKKKIVGFGKVDILYDLSKNKTIELITKYNNFDESASSNLLFNDLSTLENLANKKTLIDQKISFTNKFKTRKVFLLTGRYIHEESPENYKINQFLYQDLFSGINGNNVSQSIQNQYDFFGLEAHLLDRKKRGNLFEIQIGNQFRKDALLSSFNIFDNTTVTGVPSNYQNNFKYSTNDLYVKMKYLLKYKNLAFTGKLGVHQIFNRLEEQSNNQEAFPFFINPKIGLEWKINENNKLKSTYSYNTSNANSINVFPNYILTGFRSFTKGTGNFDQLSNSALFFSYQLGNWGSRFFANTIVLYSKQHDFFSTNSNIEQNYSQINKILIKDRTLLNVSSNIDRYFRGISSNVKLTIGFSKSNYGNVVNDNFRDIKSENYNYGIEIRSGFDGIFNYHFGTKWTSSKILTTLSNSFTNNSSFLDLSFIFNDKFNFDIEAERYFFGNLNNSNNTYYFSDFNANYIIKENKLTLSLIGKNLFNNDRFREFSISDIGSAVTEYRLLPRYVMLKIKYRF